MRREGRMHGMVQTYRIMPAPFDPIPDRRFVNRVETPPTAGLFTKVPTKPTNHSKFTSRCAKPRCNCCHVLPAGKAKYKAKGAHKIRSDVSEGLKPVVSGSNSASGMLEDYYYYYYDNDDEYYYGDQTSYVGYNNLDDITAVVAFRNTTATTTNNNNNRKNEIR